MSLGVPVKVLHEAEGHTVTLETNTGEVYRGKLVEAEDNMNCQMSSITVTYRDGRTGKLENLYIRGSKIRFLILPDMLKNAPMFKRTGGGGRKSAILRAQVSKSQVTSAAQACKILLQYLFQKLNSLVHQCLVESYCLSQNQVASIIYGLCTSPDVLTHNNVPALTAVLKLAEVSPSFAIRSSDYQESCDDLMEPKRPRLDPSATTLEQLMTPVFDFSNSKQAEGPIEMVDSDGDTTIIHIQDTGLESKSLLISKNLSSLQQLNGVEIMLNMSLSLPSIHQYSSTLQDGLAGKGLQLPGSVTEAVQISSINKETTFQIFISSGKTKCIKAYQQETIKSLKECIYDLEGIAPCYQCLYFSGNVLRDSSTLLDYNIKNNCNIQMNIKLLGGVKVVAQSRTGYRQLFEVDEEDTIADIAAQVEDQDGTPREQLEVVFRHKTDAELSQVDQDPQVPQSLVKFGSTKQMLEDRYYEHKGKATYLTAHAFYTWMVKAGYNETSLHTIQKVYKRIFETSPGMNLWIRLDDLPEFIRKVADEKKINLTLFRLNLAKARKS